MVVSIVLFNKYDAQKNSKLLAIFNLAKKKMPQEKQ